MKFKVFVKQIRIFKIRTPHQLDGMVAPLAHTADIGIPMGKKMMNSNRCESLAIPRELKMLSVLRSGCGSISS